MSMSRDGSGTSGSGGRPPHVRRAATALALAVALTAMPASGEPPTATRLDRGAIDREVGAILGEQGGPDSVGVWVGGASGEAWYDREAGAVFPTASAIKTSFLVELFARHADALDRPPEGLDAVLRDDHPAVAHFSPAQRDEIRRGLAGASVRTIGGTMMGSVPASNVVYNAAANVVEALLGGPDGLTRAIGGRDPAFAPIAVRRYMLADRHAHGDNEATPAALAAVLRRLASREVPRLNASTVEAIRLAILRKDDPKMGQVFVKDGDLATDPITCVRSGWVEGPDGGAIVYVVMFARRGPGDLPRTEAYERLDRLSRRLTGSLLDAARGVAR
jgi:hypothetical protein